MNKHLIAGNVGNDPEIKRLESGMTIAKLSVAVNEFKKNKETGESEKSTLWLNIVAFGRLAELCESYVTKGKKILVIGKLSIREYIDNDGVKKYFTETIADEIEFLSSRNDEQQQQNSKGNLQTIEEEGKDDLPF